MKIRLSTHFAIYLKYSSPVWNLFMTSLVISHPRLIESSSKHAHVNLYSKRSTPNQLTMPSVHLTKTCKTSHVTQSHIPPQGTSREEVSRTSTGTCAPPQGTSREEVSRTSTGTCAPPQGTSREEVSRTSTEHLDLFFWHVKVS